MNRSIRLMTANLLVDRAKLAHLRDVLEVVDPDFFITQELGHKAADLIASRFPHHHLRPQLDHKGRGIASRFPARFGEIPLPWRPGVWARVEQGPTEWLVGNIHLRNPIVFPWWTSARIRGRQLDALFAWADGEGAGRPLVLAGDMNASPAWPVYRRLAGRWVDLVARSAENAGETPAPTWAWRPGLPRLLRIDHEFGEGARAVASQVIPLRGTDHAAVVVDLVVDRSR
jgi:endonuclease/exonuclease/phosphatase family metal-dependent hydrolase